MEEVWRDLLAVVMVLGGICLIVFMKFQLEMQSAKMIYTCKKCGNECTKKDLKIYDYEYTADYRCKVCNAVVLED